MTRAKKILSWSLVTLLALLLVAVFAANWFLDSYSRQALMALSQRAKRHGVQITEPSFRSARIAGIKAARWTDFTVSLRFSRSDAFDENKTFDVFVRQADLWLVGHGQAVLEARGITVDCTDVATEEEPTSVDSTQGERIRAERFRCQLPLDLLHPVPSLEQALPELVGLVSAGPTQLPIDIEGTLEFTFKGAPVQARMRVDEVDGGRALVLVPADLRPLSEHFDEALTEAEIELIAAYPLRVAELLRIKDDAESTASDAKQGDDQVPEDAYRHVLWSFLLTREYGDQFAQRVTDAHEEGDTGNTHAERDMDYHNNAIGRRWAEQNVRRSELLSRILTDPEVMREPQ